MEPATAEFEAPREDRKVPAELVSLGNEVEAATLSLDRLQDFQARMVHEPAMFSEAERRATEEAVCGAAQAIERKSAQLKEALRVWQVDIGMLSDKREARASIIREFEQDLLQYPELMRVLADGQVAVERAIEKASSDIGVSPSQ